MCAIEDNKTAGGGRVRKTVAFDKGTKKGPAEQLT